MLFISNNILLASENNIPEEEPLTWYCHGLHCKTRRVPGLLSQNIIQEPADNVEFDDTQSCLGQDKDVKKLLQVLASHPKKCKLHSHSKGGNVIINGLARYNPSNVAAIVIDASPADMLDRVDEIQCSLGVYLFQSREQKEWILRQLYPAYPQGSVPPVEEIKNIKNKDLPVFIVHSDDDKIVNIRAGLKIYKAFKQAEFPHVYFCRLHHGGHNNNGKGADSHIYRTAIHSFYKKYGFKYDEQHATLQDLTSLQPSIEEVDKQIEDQEIILQEKFRFRRAVNIAIGIHAAFMINCMMKQG